MDKTLGGVWRSTQRRLEAARLDPAPRESKQLLAHVLGITEREVGVQEGDVFPSARMEDLQVLVARRLTGEPLAQVIGYAPFWTRDWKVTRDVLIPRPDSEIVLTEALKHLRDGMRVVEVGVGSGCLVGSLLLERKLMTAVGIDLSGAALGVARENLREAGVLERCELLEGDLFAGAQGLFDVVISNPPYVADDEWAVMEDGVKRFEPELALRGGGDGLEVYRRLIPAAKDYLKPGGWLCLEIGWLQALEVDEMMNIHHYKEIKLVRDLASRDRVVVGQKEF